MSVYLGGTPDHAAVLTRVGVVQFLGKLAFIDVALTTYRAEKNYWNSPISPTLILL